MSDLNDWLDEGQYTQRQDSLENQLKTVYRAATQLGCYDAADWILRKLYESSNVSNESLQ